MSLHQLRQRRRRDRLDLKDRLVDCGAVRFGEFELSSGATSSYYVDVKLASTDPSVLGRLGEAVADHAGGADRLAGMELGAVPIVAAASLASDLPFLVVRKRAKEHGTGSRIEGAFERGERVLLVEDVTTTGGSAVDAVDALRAAGLEVDACVTVVDRGEGADRALADVDVRLIPLVSAAELLEDDA